MAKSGVSKRKREVEEEEAEQEQQQEEQDWEVKDGDEDGDQDFDDDDDESAGDSDSDSDSEAVDEESEDRTNKQSSLYRLPTAAELKGYRDATNLYKSPLFQLQLEELLKEITPNYSKLTALESLLRDTKAALDKKPLDSLSLTVPEALAWATKAKVSIPFTESVPANDAKYRLVSAPPASVAVIGSFLLRHLCKTAAATGNVDLAVEMPASMFQEKDFVNHRYFHKKAFYLAVLAAHLKKAAAGGSGAGNAKSKSASAPAFKPDLSFGVVNGDRHKPVLILRDSAAASPNGTAKSRFVVRLFPVLPASVFPLHALAPARNNLRKGDDASAASGTPPTPLYNNAILSDMFAISHLNVLHMQRKACSAFDAAAVLGRSWLARRGISGEQGGFNGFLWSMLMDYLLRGGGAKEGKVPSANCSSYQLFKVTLEFLAAHDFSANPVFMTDKFQPLAGSEFSKEAFASAFDVVVVDPSGMVNLAARMSTGSLRYLQHHARRSVALLDDSTLDHFVDVFPPKSASDGMFEWDELFMGRVAAGQTDPTATADAVDRLVQKIPSIIANALSSRVDVVLARKLDSFKEWPLSSQWTDTNFTSGQAPPVLLVGCVLSPAQQGIVEHGPSSEELEAAKSFRETWGELAELRRFKDGSIRHSVVWEAPKHPDSSTEAGWGWVLRRAVPHLLKRHFDMAEVAAVGPRIDAVLKSKFEPGLVSEAFDELGKRMRALEDLPLGVLSIARASTATSDCDPAVHLFPRGSRPLTEVVLELEHTNRWPDDLEAIQKMKIALGLRIAEQFRVQFPGCSASVGGFGQEDSEADTAIAKSIPNSYIDIISERGIGFRCRLLVEREAHLLESSLASPLTAQDVKVLLKRIQERHSALFVYAPYHALHFNNRCAEFRGLAWTVKLTKFWLGKHMLSLHFGDELVELLCLSVYENPGAAEVPRSGTVGFFRVLERLATWDWRADPLIVELHQGQLSDGVRREIETNFRALRGSTGQSTHASMFVASEADKNSHRTSYDNPSWVILDRARVLAKSSVNLVVTAIKDGNRDKLKGLFHTSVKEYDVLLHLDARIASPDAAAQDVQAPSKRFKNLALAKQEIGLLREVLFPAMIYGKDLCRTYQDVAVFFADKYGGTVIGVVWNPLIARKQPFRISTPFASIPDGTGVAEGDEKPAVSPAKEVMVAEMLRLGGRLALQASLSTR